MADLSVKIITPEQALYDGPAVAISTTNTEGELSILPQHTNFISIIEDKVVIHINHDTDQEFPVDQGILFCRNDAIEIYIGIDSTAALKQVVTASSQVTSSKP